MEITISLTKRIVHNLLIVFIVSLIAQNVHGRILMDTEKSKAYQPVVRLNRTGKNVILENGIVELSFIVPEGHLIGVQYGGLNNVLEGRNKETDRGYWDVALTNQLDDYETNEIQLTATEFKIIHLSDEKAEISFLSPKTSSLKIKADKRYVLLRGHSGFYSYAIFEREKGWPATKVGQIRAVFKPRGDKFRYMAISDKIQRVMPTAQDRATGQPLAYKEAVRLTNPVEPSFKGEVDDKYQYAREDRENKVHGWISSNPPIGFWVITPSSEFRLGGPMKQSLTSHVGPTLLSMFHSTHYAGKDLIMSFTHDEPWKKVFGPILLHFNSLQGNGDPKSLWKKANHQMLKEVKSWPYNFPQSLDFAKANQRGCISGRLLVKDGFDKPIPAKAAWVGLALPGEVGSWQTEMKGYQFWDQTDNDGMFFIKHIRAGDYNFYATVLGFIGDFKFDSTVVINPGTHMDLGELTFEPPRTGPTLWEIGTPDRSAAEFFVPDPNPDLQNKLFLNDEDNKYRQYGLWDRYTDLYPTNDLTYIVNFSDYRKDWFFAHVLRNTKSGYMPTTWNIIFHMKHVKHKATYTLQVALASATESELQVRINKPAMKARPLFTTKLIGRDNAIARHGIHGLYRLYSIPIASSLLHKGNNTIFLSQTRNANTFNGIMYDYIRLEGPTTLR